MEIGKAISKRRKERGLTQKELSKRTRLSRTYISDIENDRYAPSLKTLEIIAKKLSFKLSDLFKEMEEAE